MFTAAAGAVAEGGLLAWEAFTAAARRRHPSLAPGWRPAPGEPASLLPADFTLLDQSDLPGPEKPLRRQMVPPAVPTDPLRIVRH